ncbi:hypothetical protein B0H14DRAFT_3445083 [Mycena olivaceomarginata]|nr:hypothetical protein B0H14DRAFT_3445083 [Mycena olivaceomarginata]
MKRSNDGTDKIKKRAKNTFSLQSWGHSLNAPNNIRAAKLTADGRRADIQVVPIQRERGLVPPPPAFEDDYEWEDMQVDDEPPATMRPPRKRKRYTTTDDNLRHWVEKYRDQYLRVLVTREGLLGEEQTCFLRSAGELPEHRLRPLCRIEAWNGTFFDRRDLRQLGLRVQLGHPDNRRCPHAHPGREKFVVIAPNGFHSVAVDFCQCRRSGSQPHWEQLLSYGWYPATPDNPQTVITIATLKLFHAVSLQGKTTAYHFFNALAKITDNTGSNAFKNRYQLALRVVRQWRNLRALKRGGMGNDPNRRTAATREGELAVDCLACPKVGVNLAEGWKKAPMELRRAFLYCIFLAIDTCFRLKRKKISSWSADPSIQDGWVYFTRSGPYTEFVETLGEQKEMSTCTGLAALDHANTKYSQGYAVTGCGMITCSRHEIVCKNGVGDLQAGEKYGNMDYVVASAWRHLRDLLFFLLSYDIMCQWVKNLRNCLLKLPPALRFQLAHYFVKFVIPKLHILGHLKFCQDFFSLLYTLGSAQADMEGIERIWSSSGLMGASTREMGPGSRQDTLDNFWHYWNWNKVVGMGTTLRTRLIKAKKELKRQEEGLEEFTAAQEEEASAWKEAVDAFELPHAGPTLRDVELELMREEQERESSTSASLDADDDTMIEYLMLGLVIEAQQRQLAADLLAKKHPTSKELTDFIHALHRCNVSPLARIRWNLRNPSVPRSSFLLAFHRPKRRRRSLYPGSPLLRHGFVMGNVAKAWRQSATALTVKKRLQTYKTLNSRRQHQNTRSRSLVNGQQQKIDSAAGTYRRARAARLALVHVMGECSWHALEKGDLRLPEDEEEAKRRKQRAMKAKWKEAAQVNENGEVRGVPGMGEKNRLVSWIWYGAGSTEGAVGEAMYASVRVEWSKVYARVKRWREETLLLQEEMVRCLRTLEWQAACWDERALSTHYRGQIKYTAPHLQGAIALAAKQAAVRRELACRFRRCWWRLSDRIARPQAGDSGQSGQSSDEDWEDWPFTEMADPGGEQQQEEEEEEEEGAEERRRVKMDELLTIQTTYIQQYDEI